MTVEPAPPRRSVVPVLIGTIAVALLGTAVLWWTLGPNSSAPGEDTVEPVVTEPSASASSVVPTLDFEQAMTGAWRRARAWSPDAALCHIALPAVRDGRAAPDSRITLTFGQPSGRLGPGAPVNTAGFAVEVAAEGTVDRQTPLAASARVVAPPECSVDAAWRAAVASGLLSSRDVSMRYDQDAKLDRALWTASQGATTRVLDGKTCAIVKR